MYKGNPMTGINRCHKLGESSLNWCHEQRKNHSPWGQP